MVRININVFKFCSIRVVFRSVVFGCKFIMVIILKIVGWKNDRKLYYKFVLIGIILGKKVLVRYDKL